MNNNFTSTYISWHQLVRRDKHRDDKTRHRETTSMYSLTFRVRVATPAQYGRNGTASLQITSHKQQARRFYRWCVRAYVVRAACAGPGGLPLGSATHFHNIATATHPMHRLQIRAIVSE